MVSARPPPNPVKGRIAYPSASTYTPGDQDASPNYLGSSAPMSKTLSQDSDNERVQGLKTWWKSFRDKTEPARQQSKSDDRQVFGIALSESLDYASVQISTAGNDGELYVWGVIPVVVAKCGLYLKEHGTDVEGTFRISGSAKRMRDLQTIFDNGPKFGKNIDWSNLPYTTHDVATIFRRFLTQMPEPVIPFDLYPDFRNTYAEELSTEQTIERYKRLIKQMPPVNQYLLLYVLDLLSVFAKNAEKNLMTAPNLALIFQPGILSHPIHSMRPREHVLSQQVLEFLIEQQDHFLLEMSLKPQKKRKPKSQRTASIRPTSPRPPSAAPPSIGAASPNPPASSVVDAGSKEEDTEAAAPAVQAEPEKPAEPVKPVKPKPVMKKADADFMPPSDSDDDVPEGGYYIVESEGFPKASGSRPPAPAHLTVPTVATSGVIPKPPQRNKTRTQSASSSKSPRPQPIRLGAQPSVLREEMEPSDSDEDAPTGGYEVRTVDPEEKQRVFLTRTKSTSSKPTDSVRQAGTEQGSSIVRRKTLPAGRNNGPPNAALVRRRQRAKEV